LKRLVKSFVARVRRGDLKNALYLTYYYMYLGLYDVKHKTHFAVSHRPDESDVPLGGTGNFPAHPKIVRRLLVESGLLKSASIIDVGHGSGIALHVASKMGFNRLTGVEYGEVPFVLSRQNLGTKASLHHGDALAFNLEDFDGILFFSPFRGELANRFFFNLPVRPSCLVLINHDRLIEKGLAAQGFVKTYQYQHLIYKNFNGQIWMRKVHT
jgi:hypothetical protein